MRDRAAVAPKPLQDTSLELAKATKTTTRNRVWTMLLVIFTAGVTLVEQLLAHALMK